ncbi:pectate lyase-like adhesive domain-containing protein [Salisediminibacterium selenitireducens]|uniref:Uncharacterized protein n=1 Tax=Bacillus selenitireducens (strain ATCC 700615 / DSM 15326 / MLS10) TaxID=439292 RepID=D6Y077_BACIE|nr:pectate lyase-like adhesive domain-containing protein [Salisediminibacterium selenitireducens]ADH98468.1 hypothetical protein Bsel_0946 [[Bacillus] selenitireducens MLS10]
MMNKNRGLKPFLALIMSSLVIFVAFALAPGATSDLPYTYSFEEDQSSTFNQIGTLNKMNVTFSYDIKPFDYDEAPLIKASSPGIIKGAESDGRTLTVYFSNVSRDSFLDYTCEFGDGCEQELVIPAGSLTDGHPPLPVEDYRLPFSMDDILPGFKTIFIDSTEAAVNRNVLSSNSPREVNIHIPPVYMTEIETIHRYEGIESSARLRPLTNIDIAAEDDVERIKLQFGAGNNQYDRELARRNIGGFNGFTTGQAGLEADLFDEGESNLNPEQFRANEIRLDAYDAHGRYLETRSFRLSVRDKSDDFIVNDYIGDIPDHFGETYTLYEMMEDPELLEEVVSLVPVGELNRLGVSYTNRLNSRDVSSYEELLRAVDAAGITTINLTEDINPPSGAPPLVFKKDVTVNGNGHTLGVRDLRAGDGSGSRQMAFRNINIDHGSQTSELTIHTGLNGIMILDDVSVTGGIDIRSAGERSVYLHDVEARHVDVTAREAVRVVISGNTSLEANDHRGLYVQTKANHRVDIFSNDIRVIAGNGGHIESVYVYGENTFIDYENDGSIGGIYGKGVTDLIFDEAQIGQFSVMDSQRNWSEGRVLRIEEVTLSNGTNMFFGQSNISWSLTGTNIPPNVEISWNADNSYLRIRNEDGQMPDRGVYELTFEGRSDSGDRLNYSVDLTIEIN